jgi:hypothetical protein
MRWSREGLTEATCLLEAATLGRSVMPVCLCGHCARFEAHGLWWHFERQGWNDSLASARSRFWCRLCRSRQRRKIHPDRLELVVWTEGDFELP